MMKVVTFEITNVTQTGFFKDTLESQEQFKKKF